MNSNSETQPPASKTNEVVSFIKTVIFVVIFIVFIRGTIIAPYKIPSRSMVPTLEVGDHILVTKFLYGIRLSFIRNSLIQYATPNRNDIVVFTREDDPATQEDDSEPDIIKRVIGLPGETVRVEKSAVYINDVKLEEPFVRWVAGGREDFGPQTVPEGHVLVLGDNRDESKDARFWSNPFLDIRRIKGRAQIIYWSWHDFWRIGTILR